MKLSNLSLTALLIASVSYAAYLHFEVDRLREELKSQPANVVAAETRDLKPEAESEQTEEQVASVASSAPQVATVTTNLGAAAQAESDEPTRDERRRERMQRMAEVFNDPQMRVDMIERQMNRIDSRYADFFKRLNLSRDDMDTLRTLMAEQGVLNWESRMRRFGAESDEERELLAAQREMQQDVLKDEIQALLGEEDAKALKDYTDTLPYRGEVESLASSLSYTESPLSAQQSEALVSSIRDVEKSFEYTKDLSDVRGPEIASVSAGEIDRYFSEREARDSQILEAASESLNDSQLAAYAERQLAERERDRRQMEFMKENPLPGRGGDWGRRPGGR